MNDQSKYIDTKGIAADLELTQQHVTDRVVTRDDFPEPAIALSQKTRKWLRVHYQAWKKKRERAAVRRRA